MVESAELCYCGRPAGHTGRHKGSSVARSKLVDIAQSKRVSLQVTESQLNQLILSWPLDKKVRLVNLLLGAEADDGPQKRARMNGIRARRRAQ